MPKSEFLDLQDKNHDGLIDECEDLSIVPAAQCKGCVPNPVALTPNWMKKDETEPFLNEKICKFQITVQSDFSTTLEKSALAVTPEKPGPDAAQQEVLMRKRYKAYEDVAIAGLLDSYNKDPGTESQKKLKEVIEYTKFNLAPHGTSKVQFLYSVPHDTLMEIDEAPPDDDDVEDEGSDTVVKYGTSDIHIKLIRIRKALDLYNRYLKVFRAMEGGNIFFDETGAVFNLEDYGDFPGFGGLSVTGELMIGLDTWLGNKGYNIPGFQWSFFKDRVQDIEFTFNKDFKLKKLRIWTQDCAEKPITWTSSLKSLQRYSAWKDPTACAYLARLDAMETDLMARTPKPWLEFVKEHTFPKVHSTAAPETDPVEDVGSCIADALGKEFKQLGQDILDDVFSIGDAVAKSFHKRLCQESAKDMMEDFGRMGLVTGPIAEKFAKDRDKNTWALAMEQSYGVLEQDDPLVGNFCSVLCGTPGRNNLMGDPWAQLDNLWKHNLDKLKFCGLLDLMMNAIECLFKGLSLEEALASMLKAALKSMNLEDFGQLFVGLPPEKQAELDALVKQKLAENQIFKDGSANALAMDNVAGNYASIPKPWLDGTLVEQSKKDQREAGLEATAPAELQDPNEGGYKPLGEQFRIGAAAAQGLDSGVIMEAYALGLIEVFNDNLLALLDELNKFPGAPIVAFILAQMDCPRPPIFNPSILDFIKDIELPICNNLNDITFPKFINPFSWLPSLWDILGYLWWALKRAALNLLISIVMRIICKICEIIGDAVCKALELAGSVVAGIPDMISGRNSFTNIVRESICGPNADDDVVDDTVAEMFEKLGGAGANLADREAVKNFTEDLSSSITQQELFEAMLGNASESFKKMGGTLLNAEGNAGIAAAFKNGEGLATFCGNVGKLMSAEDRQQMRDALDASPDDLNYPVNPSLCASPEQLEEYEKVRCEVLEGRATPEQCQQMFENLKEQTLDDLDQLSQVAQGGIPNQFEREAPPLYSDPGCDNGFLPFEPEEVISTVGAVLDGNMEQLKIDFSQDMLGNGGIFDLQEDWGLMNMILSDTLGNPLSTHKRRVFNSPAFGSRNYVDFYMDIDVDKDDDEAFGKIAPIYDQRGAYPEKVAGWLQDELGGLTVEYKSNNDWEKDQPFSKHYDTLELDTDDNLAILKMPDFGFNIGFSTDIENEKIKFTKRGRKKTPDVTLRFEDNSNGQRLGDDSTGTEWTYGFDISLFMSDLIENSGDDSPHNIGSVTTPWDATRVVVTDLHNLNGGSSLTAAAKSVMTDEEIDEFNDNSDDSGESILDEQRFEFVAVDDSLGPDKVNLDQYPELLSCFVTQTAQTPALVLLGELTGVSPGALKSQYDEIMGTLIQQIATEVKDNEDAFSYGAVFDGLTASETEYVVSAGQTESPAGTLYNEAEVKDDDSGDLRKIKNMDTILGISRMQFNRGEEESRVLYLDPNTFGGSYMNPPLYIKPVPNKGWLGFVEVMFPNIGPCKPQRSDLIDFGDIQSKMGQDYPTLPEDKRLKGEPECIRELPYNRVLMRASTAGITALLSAACRIYASVHFIKAFATFTRFAPKFPDNYSNIFSQYIVENMERGFKDAQGSWAEFWNTFKDDEFWYGFLEQAVQQYERRLEKGEFQEMYGGDPPPYVQTALLKLGAKQESFHNIGEQALHDARDTSAASIFTSLTEYRTEQNLKFVRKTEESAKIILGELVREQLQYMGDKFVKNLEGVGIKPKYNNLDFYILTQMSKGGIDLDLDKEIKEEISGLPTEGNDLYTGGGELSQLDGEVYVGFYHVVEEDGEPVYVKGEVPQAEQPAEENLLRPFANKVTIPIGDLEDYGYATAYNAETPFVIEKYIRIKNAKYDWTEAQSVIASSTGDLTQNISEIYPGTMEKVVNENGQVVGLKGILGVRYGIKFSLQRPNGEKKEITSVEVDALDTELQQIGPLEGNSKLLWCLLRNLADDEKFRLTCRFIFPVNKATSLIALYNDNAFLPSIGQITVAKDKTYGYFPSKPGLDDKPGMSAIVEQEDGNIIIDTQGNPGWASNDDRSGAWWVTEWDSWDQVLLRNSKSRIKKIFKSMYNDRDFGPGKGDRGPSAATMWLQGMKETLFGRSGAGALPRHKKSLLRSNPYNADGQLCKKQD